MTYFQVHLTSFTLKSIIALSHLLHLWVILYCSLVYHLSMCKHWDDYWIFNPFLKNWIYRYICLKKIPCILMALFSEYDHISTHTSPPSYVQIEIGEGYNVLLRLFSFTQSDKVTFMVLKYFHQWPEKPFCRQYFHLSMSWFYIVPYIQGNASYNAWIDQYSSFFQMLI